MPAKTPASIKVIRLPFDSDPLVVEVVPTLTALQALVGGGCIEVVPIGRDGLELVCDEEGKLKGLPWNLEIFGGQDVVAGDAFLMRHDRKGEPASVTDTDVARFVGKGRVRSL